MNSCIDFGVQPTSRRRPVIVSISGNTCHDLITCSLNSLVTLRMYFIMLAYPLVDGIIQPVPGIIERPTTAVTVVLSHCLQSLYLSLRSLIRCRLQRSMNLGKTPCLPRHLQRTPANQPTNPTSNTPTTTRKLGDQS